MTNSPHITSLEVPEAAQQKPCYLPQGQAGPRVTSISVSTMAAYLRLTDGMPVPLPWQARPAREKLLILPVS